MALLKDFAYARSGDKGSHVNIGVIAIRSEDYPFLCANLTEKRVMDFFSALHPSRVQRFDVPNLHALNFLLYDVLDGGGSLNLRVDAQGKALGQALLQMPIEKKP
jgi:hypothetical protein